MGNFYSVLHYIFNWKIEKQKQPVDEVAEWLRKNDLEEYFPKFVEYGWDHLSVISEMTESDIEMCIQKPGHKVKLKRAISHPVDEVIPSIDLGSGMDTSSYQEARRTALKETLLSSAHNNFTISEDSKASIDTFQPHQHCSAVASNTSNVVSDLESDREHMCEGEGIVISEIRELREPVTTPLDNQKVDDEQGLNISSDIEQETYGVDMDLRCALESTESDVMDKKETEKEQVAEVNKKQADTNTLRFDGASMISKEMNRPQHISVLTQNCVCTPESSLAQTAADGTTLNLTSLTIIEHSEHTLIKDNTTNNIEPDEERTAHHSDCLLHQMSTIASVFEEKDALYVETNAYNEMKTIVEDRYWATILGKAGDGKSATAAHLLLYYQKTKGYQPCFLTSVRQWDSLISSKQSAKQFVIIDDMFGSIVLDGRKTEEWLVEIDRMEKIVMKRKGDLIVVCTSRRHIFKDAEPKLYKHSCFRKASIVDMTEKENKLSNCEKAHIFERYSTKYGIGLHEETLNQIKTIDSPHGFPHCVEMYCTNAFLRESGIRFFENPEEFVQKELHNFKDNDPFKFLVLLLVLYNRNRIHLRYFGTVVENSDEEVEKLCKFTGVSLSTSYASMVNAVHALTNTYLTETRDGYYTFTHESLKENVARVYTCLNPAHATQLLDFQQILTYLGKPTTVKLPENELAERLTIELMSGNVDSVSTCVAWQDPTFVDEWIRFVKMAFESNRLYSGLSTFLMMKMFYPSQGQYFTSFGLSSMITSLLANKMFNAVIAMLNDEYIQKVLKKDEPILLKSLESGLEIVCRVAHNIQVVKDIIAFQRSSHLRVLNCTKALTNALRASDAETALYLVNHTSITVDELGFGIRHSPIQTLFSSSLNLVSFKQLCTGLIQTCDKDTLLQNYIKIANTKFCFEKFEYLVELAINVNASTSKAGINVIDLIIETLTAEQCLKVLPILKKTNANLTYVNKKQMNALHTICMKRNMSQYFDVLRYLVKAGVDPTHELDDGTIPLMFALQNDPGEDCLRWLLSVSPQGHTNKIGQGYFHYLLQSWCKFDYLEKYCNILFEANEEINLSDRAGATPIMYFLQNSGHRQDFKDLTLFLTFLHSTEIDFRLTDNDGRNTLHYTFQAPRALNARELQEHFMSAISPEEDAFLSTAFDFLVDKVNVDCFLADRKGINPLMIALENYSESKSVRKFFNRNIPNKIDRDGRNYFHYLHLSRERLDKAVMGRILISNIVFDADYDLMDLIVVSKVIEWNEDWEVGTDYSDLCNPGIYETPEVQKITNIDIDMHFSQLVVALMNSLTDSQSCT